MYIHVNGITNVSIHVASCPCLPENTDTSTVTYLCYEGATTPCNCDNGVCQVRTEKERERESVCVCIIFNYIHYLYI